MEPEDILFEDLQSLSDDAEALGLKDVALVLEFAMDVYLHEKGYGRQSDPKPEQRPVIRAQELVNDRRPDAEGSASAAPQYLLAQVYRQAS